MNICHIFFWQYVQHHKLVNTLNKEKYTLMLECIWNIWNHILHFYK